MTLLGKTPPQKWSDDQCLHAIECLSDLAVRLRDLETLDHAVQARPVGQDREIVLLRSVSSADGERPGRIAYISPDQRPLIDAHAERINVLLENLENQELRLAIIARLLQVEN